MLLHRSGKYILNTSTGSDGDLLLNSPGRDKDVSQQENCETKHDSTTHNTTPSTSHDPTATPSSNGLEAAATSSDSILSLEEQRKVLNSNANNCTKNTDSNATNTTSNSGCNSEAGSGEGKVNSEERLPDGEVDSEKELQDNFK